MTIAAALYNTDAGREQVVAASKRARFTLTFSGTHAYPTGGVSLRSLFEGHGMGHAVDDVRVFGHRLTGAGGIGFRAGKTNAYLSFEWDRANQKLKLWANDTTFGSASGEVTNATALDPIVLHVEVERRTV